MEGSGAAGRTIHVNATFHGRFSIQERTLHGEGRYHGWFRGSRENRPCYCPVSWKVQYPGANLPRRRPISWMVRSKTAEPSTLEAHIMEGSIFRSEPSMSEVDFVEGSGAAGRTIHDNAPYHGRFNIQGRTIHVGGRYHGWFRGSRANRPCYCPVSWKVQYPEPNLPRRRPI